MMRHSELDELVNVCSMNARPPTFVLVHSYWKQTNRYDEYTYA